VEKRLVKRFYNAVATHLQDHCWHITLDGRAIKTAGGNAQALPSLALAEAMAAEWAEQGEEIDPRAFQLRDLADYAIDVAAGAARGALVDEIAAYADTDTLCYRADPDEALHARQLAVWEPMLTRAERRHGVRFLRVSGIVHRPQPRETLTRLHAAVAGHDAFGLAALRMLTSLTASLVIALAALQPDADADALWLAANLEEDWQAQNWGRDPEAETLREARRAAFGLAIRLAALSRAA
jgi:chaperone required for assembly of F1-ATPase